jgi:glycosyltransferase involved in cell wall biosynthesis
MKPLISIIITNYNYEEYVAQAIKSALDQTYKNLEVIIYDDFSTDNSDEVIKQAIRNKKISYVRNSSNLGPQFTRNNALKQASGEYIFILDADNYLNPDHINKLYKALIDNDADVAYGNLQNCGDSNELRIMPKFDIEILKKRNFIDTSSLVKKSALQDYRFDTNLNRKCFQDYDFFLGLALAGLKFVYVADANLNYRIHNQSISAKNSDIIQKLTIQNEILSKWEKQYPDLLWSMSILEQKVLIDEVLNLRSRVAHSDENIATLEQSLERVRKSRSYRIGQIITAPYRLIKNLL